MRGPCTRDSAARVRANYQGPSRPCIVQGRLRWLRQDSHCRLRAAHELGALLRRQARVVPEACADRAAVSAHRRVEGRQAAAAASSHQEAHGSRAAPVSRGSHASSGAAARSSPRRRAVKSEKRSALVPCAVTSG